MTAVLRLWPLLTATHRYDKTLSTRNRGAGTTIEAPILAYLIETTNGRVLSNCRSAGASRRMAGSNCPPCRGNKAA